MAHISGELILFRPRNMRPRMMKLGEKIRFIRLRAKMNQKQFADALGFSQGTVSRWENDEQIPDYDAMKKLAEFAGDDTFVDVPDLDDVAFDREKGSVIKIVGAVQAGEWVEAVEWVEPGRMFMDLPVVTGFDLESLEGFLVMGESMDLLYPEGSVVFAIPTISNGVHPVHGDRVIVQRRNNQGEFEVTLKEYIVDPQGRAWLWPRSSNPDFSQPINLTDRKGENVDEVVVTGIVTHAFVVQNPKRVWG